MNALITKTSLSVFAVALTLLSADVSPAGVRARVDIQKDIGPATLRVRLQSPDHVRWHHEPVRVRHQAPWVRVSAYDRDVAFRLSFMTGVPERPLLEKRARGITWKRIARVHHIGHRALKIAKAPKRFDRWLYRNGYEVARWNHGGHDVHRYDRHDRCDHGPQWGQGKGHGKGEGHGAWKGRGRGKGRR